MTTTQHHPSESWLLDYAVGNLPEMFETVIRAHVGACAECREAVHAAEAFGGELLAAMTAPGSNGGLSAAHICDHYEQGGGLERPASRAFDGALTDDLEQFVGTYLHSSLDALPWRRLGAGLKICQLSEQDGARMWMLRGEPGTVLPEHTHAGSELTLVLKGAYFCGSDIYRAGDIEDADETVDHQPVITRDGECICLAVTEGNLRFHGWLPRLAQPFIGI
ncbi:MAG: ChrR family anti-sigma-E factor [Gammaproteobacteria bacterium]